MKIMRRLLGYDDKFFDLLEKSATEAQSSVDMLVNMLRNKDDLTVLDNLSQSRRKDKRITEEITAELCRTFVTPLEREDIEALSSALFRITKLTGKFSERYLLYLKFIKDVSFTDQACILAQSTDMVGQMVGKLRGHPHIEEMKAYNDQLHHMEKKADELMIELLKDLYSGKHEIEKVMILSDLYETLEKIIDRCRDVGNVIFGIVLKYS
jgi:uncharacterized protein Yka (UPF0111/DUF47 family)